MRTYKNHRLQKISETRQGTWVAQPVKCLPSAPHWDLRVWGLSSLHRVPLRGEPAPLSPLPFPTPFMCALSCSNR